MRNVLLTRSHISKAFPEFFFLEGKKLTGPWSLIFPLAPIAAFLVRFLVILFGPLVMSRRGGVSACCARWEGVRGRVATVRVLIPSLHLLGGHSSLVRSPFLPTFINLFSHSQTCTHVSHTHTNYVSLRFLFLVIRLPSPESNLIWGGAYFAGEMNEAILT